MGRSSLFAELPLSCQTIEELSPITIRIVRFGVSVRASIRVVSYRGALSVMSLTDFSYPAEHRRAAISAERACGGFAGQSWSPRSNGEGGDRHGAQGINSSGLF